jgi:hypothetical protein
MAEIALSRHAPKQALRCLSLSSLPTRAEGDMAGLPPAFSHRLTGSIPISNRAMNWFPSAGNSSPAKNLIQRLTRHCRTGTCRSAGDAVGGRRPSARSAYKADTSARRRDEQLTVGRHVFNARRNSGCSTATRSSVLAAPVGSRRPCSQSCRVRGETPKRWADQHHRHLLGDEENDDRAEDDVQNGCFAPGVCQWPVR